MLSPYDLDSWLYKVNSKNLHSEFLFIETPYGSVRYIDSGGNKPILLMVPDGPCFIEHFDELFEKARKSWRVVIFDMPGFGLSHPSNSYNHSFKQATEVIKSVCESLSLTEVTLSFSCANGFYALYFSKLYPQLIKKVYIIQTPSFTSMQPWIKRSIPAPIRIPYLGQAIVYKQRYKIPKAWYSISLPRNSKIAPCWTKISNEKIKSGACNCLASVVQGLNKMNEDTLKGVNADVTLIWGRLDHSHKNTDENSILDIVPNAKVIVWEDVGHFANLEEPDRFLELISNT